MGILFCFGMLGYQSQCLAHSRQTLYARLTLSFQCTCLLHSSNYNPDPTDQIATGKLKENVQITAYQ